LLEKKRGTFTFIYGPMFSGKTEELLRIGKRYEIGRKSVVYFKPASDNRYGTNVIITHSKLAKPAREIVSFEDVYPVVQNELCHAILIDEIQFLTPPKQEHLFYLMDSLGIDIVASGLVLDANRTPFPTSTFLLPYVDIHIKLESVCNACGNFDAMYTQLKAGSFKTGQVLIGGSELYRALCKNCYANMCS
jgi:thymidine kinase